MLHFFYYFCSKHNIVIVVSPTIQAKKICKLNIMKLNKTFKAYTLYNYKKIPQIKLLSDEDIFAIDVVSQVLPFKSNSYVIEELINWENVPDDPIFTLTFPRKDMLIPEHFEKMASLIKSRADKEDIKKAANEIRLELNPHPAGQMDHNIPSINGKRIIGMQHKYRETALFFPSQGQTCHAYCTFCFRWPQFVGIDDLKFASKEANLLKQYLQLHTETTNILFTGGDPMVMKAEILARYIEPLLTDVPNLTTIRIGTKALAYWPYKFLSDSDSFEMMELFEKIVKSGKHLAIMAHFNHPVELSTPAVKKAIKRLRSLGAEIRTQSPLLKHINDDPEIWAAMWRKQVNLGCIPYYMFVARDTGAQHYFSITLENAYNIYRKAYTKVSGVCRTVRGPSMSASPGKVQVLGVITLNGKKVFLLQFLQGRNPDWVKIPFIAEYNANATWLNDLKPAYGEKEFFWEEEYKKITRGKVEIIDED